MARKLKLACLQTRPKANVEEAIKQALHLADLAVAKGIQFLFLPEYCGGLQSVGSTFSPPSFSEGAHPFLKTFKAYSRKHSIFTMIGSIAISGEKNRIINRGFVIDCLGRVLSSYDKIHMFDIQISETEVYRESANVTAGALSSLVNTPFAQVGHTICYDLRFPHLYRDLSKAGAEILCVPAAFTKKTGQAHWHILNQARAIENGAFVVSPCAVGSIKGGGECYGHSLIVNPWGEILADGGTDVGVVISEINLDEVLEARKKIPSLMHDKPYTRSK